MPAPVARPLTSLLTVLNKILNSPLILLSLIICLGFSNIYANCPKNSSLRKENIRVVSITSEQLSYIHTHACTTCPRG